MPAPRPQDLLSLSDVNNFVSPTNENERTCTREKERTNDRAGPEARAAAAAFTDVAAVYNGAALQNERHLTAASAAMHRRRGEVHFCRMDMQRVL